MPRLQLDDVVDFCIRQLHGLLQHVCLVRLQVHDDFRVGVADDRLTVFAVFKLKKLRNVLRHRECAAAIRTDRAENFHDILCCAPVGIRSDQFPALVNENSLALGAVFLDFAPNEIQHNEHG